MEKERQKWDDFFLFARENEIFLRLNVIALTINRREKGVVRYEGQRTNTTDVQKYHNDEWYCLCDDRRAKSAAFS